MKELTNEFRTQVAEAILNARKNFGGTDEAFATTIGIHKSIYSRLKSKEIIGLIADEKWLTIGRKFNIRPGRVNLIHADTEVYLAIKEDVLFCKKNSKMMIFADDCEIGKTHTAKKLCLELENCFRVDCSQARTKHLLIRELAKVIGVEFSGRYADVKESIISRLEMLEDPIVIFDDAGDLDLNAFLEIKGFWNGNEGTCGWYLIGDDSLTHLIETAIRNHKPGFRALLSRGSSKFVSITPNGRNDKLVFYEELIKTVLEVNVADKKRIPELTKKCLVIEKQSTRIGGLRRLESILILNSAA